jgi:hypothetical protein
LGWISACYYLMLTSRRLVAVVEHVVLVDVHVLLKARRLLVLLVFDLELDLLVQRLLEVLVEDVELLLLMVLQLLDLVYQLCSSKSSIRPGCKIIMNHSLHSSGTWHSFLRRIKLYKSSMSAQGLSHQFKLA